MKLVKQLALLAFLISLPVFASSQAFYKNLQVINIGLGLGGNYNYYSSFSSSSPAIGVSYEKGFIDDWGPGTVGFGAYLGTKTNTYRGETADGSIDYKWNNTIIGARAAYHYNPFEVRELDIYGGLALSYHLTTIKDRSTYINDRPLRKSPDYIDLSLLLGSRYYFANDWGAFLELGYGISAITIGASYQF